MSPLLPIGSPNRPPGPEPPGSTASTERGRNTTSQTGPPTVVKALLAVSAVSVAAGIAMFATLLVDEARYGELSSAARAGSAAASPAPALIESAASGEARDATPSPGETLPDPGASESEPSEPEQPGPSLSGPGISWDSVPADAVAWATVANTPVDCPVAWEDPLDPGRWLTHDLWGRWSIAGCPFGDARCSPEGPRVLVFGHHIAFSDLAFSCLQNASDPAVFATIGPLRWQTRLLDTVLEPLCAMVVHMSYQPIQQLWQCGEDDLRNWATSLASQADVRSERWETLAGTCDRVVVLCTCTSDSVGAPWRTLVFFAHAAGS